MTEYQHSSEKSSRLNRLLFFSICAIPFLTTIAFGAVDIWALALMSGTMGIFLVIWAADSFFENEIVFSLNPLQLPILGLILIGLIQLLPFGAAPISNLPVPPVNSLSIAPYSTRLAIIQLCIYLVFFAISLVVIQSEKRVRRLVYVFIIFGAIMAFLAILQRLASPENLIYGLRESSQAIPFGSFINQHHYAAFLEMMIALPVALLFGKATKRDGRALLGIATFVMSMAILFTGSRGGFLGLLAIIAFIFAANTLNKQGDHARESGADTRSKFRRNFAFIGGGIAIFIVVAGAVLYLTNDSTISRVAEMPSGSQEFSSGRTHFWSVALQIFKDYPIIGSGLDSFGTGYTNYDTWNGQFRVEYVHNDYLQILSDAGIFGFLCIASFIYLLFKQSLKVIAGAKSRFLRNTAIGSSAGCFGILVHSFFDFPLRTPSNSYFFLVLAVLATTSIAANAIKTRK